MADQPNVVFSISTDLEFRGRQLKAIKPDANGVYKGIPLTVIGINSRNNVCYDKNSVIDCLTNENSRFVMNLRSGDLEGEWGHPLLDPDPKKMLSRLLYLDRTKVSHHFTKVYAKDTGNGSLIVYGDVKPSGPYGKDLKANFEDATRNASFSLRAATIPTKTENNVIYKRMLAMFTFDAVDGPGYVEASKRFQDPSFESLGITTPNEGCVDVSASRDDFLSATEALQATGLESKIVDQCVLDAFGCDEVVVKEKVLKKVRDGFVDSSGSKVSIFDQAFGF
ncbi:MAG: hypothetical protein J6S93_00420 [Paludibacteraceae bacterium]|nr:hypothetical protein [Paludibacteraceae bacterium]